jgi:ectoine hydroxylase-related dioxygenase (phytanoyl-CoA dioxygenase family)
MLSDEKYDWGVELKVDDPVNFKNNYQHLATHSFIKDSNNNYININDNKIILGEFSATNSVEIIPINLKSLPSYYLNYLKTNGFCLLSELFDPVYIEKTNHDLEVLEHQELTRKRDGGVPQNQIIHSVTMKKNIDQLDKYIQHRMNNLIPYSIETARIIADPVILGIVRHYLGSKIRLGTGGSNTLIKQNDTMDCGLGWHVDFPYQFIEEKDWNYTIPYGLQALVSLREFTEDNGGTIFQPNSHTKNKWPTSRDTGNDEEGCKILNCGPGSVLLAHSSWWHRQAINISRDDRRAILSNYTLGSFTPKSDMVKQYDLLYENNAVTRELPDRDKYILELLLKGVDSIGSTSSNSFNIGGMKTINHNINMTIWNNTKTKS